MKHLHIVGKVLAAVFSVLFAVLLFPEIVGIYGIPKSLFFTMLGVGFIWLLYFLLGSLFNRLYQEGKKEGANNNTDFV